MSRRGRNSQSQHPNECYCSECRVTVPRVHPPEPTMPRGRGGQQNIQRYMVPRNGQNWGAIRNINRHRAARRNDPVAGPSTRSQTRAPTPPVHEETEWDDMDFDIDNLFPDLDDPLSHGAGGGTSGGPGATVGDTAIMFRALADPPFTRCFSHYMTFQFRNMCSSAWARGPVTGDLLSSDAIWSDYQGFMDHTIGFYMDSRDWSTISSMGTRTAKIVSAGWTCLASNVYQNAQVGGTDLRYANYNGADPRIYEVSSSGIMYPQWRFAQQNNINPTACATPTAPEITYTALDTAIRMSRYKPVIAPRLCFGYTRRSTDPPIFDQSADGINNVFEYRNLNAQPATQMKGYSKQMKTWSGEFQFPYPLIPGSANSGGVQLWSNTQKRPVFVPQQDFNSALSSTTVDQVKPAVIKTGFGGALPFPSSRTANSVNAQKDFFFAFPVGPMENAPYSMVNSAEQEVNVTKHGNRPFMAKLQDILTPDGAETDYTVEMVIKTDMCWEFNTQALGLGAAAPGNVGHYLHNYGTDNFTYSHQGLTVTAGGEVTLRDSYVSHDLFNLTHRLAVPAGTSSTNITMTPQELQQVNSYYAAGSNVTQQDAEENEFENFVKSVKK